MMFSATSLTDARNAAGSAVPRQRALDRARRHRLAAPAAGTAPATARPPRPSHRPHTPPWRARCVRPHRRRSRRRTLERPGELRTDARLVDLTRCVRLEARQHAAAVRVAIRLTPRDFDVPRLAAICNASADPVRKAFRRKDFRTTIAHRGPAAARNPTSRRRRLVCGGRARRSRRRDRTDSRTIRRRRQHLHWHTGETASNTSATSATGVHRHRRGDDRAGLEPVPDQRGGWR